MWIPHCGYIELDGDDETTYIALRPDELRLVIQALDWAEQEPEVSPAELSWYQTASGLLRHAQPRRAGRLDAAPATLDQVATDD